jgi:hypothetical protein
MAELFKLMPCQRNESRIAPDDRGPGRLEQTYSKSEERLEATEQVVRQDKQNKHPAYQVHGVPGYEMKVLFIIFCPQRPQCEAPQCIGGRGCESQRRNLQKQRGREGSERGFQIVLGRAEESGC